MSRLFGRVWCSADCLPSEAMVISVFDEGLMKTDLIGLCSIALITKAAKWFDLHADGADPKPAGQVQLNIVCQKVL